MDGFVILKYMLMIYLGTLETEEERDSFEKFYKKYIGRCLAVANKITRNRAWAEEAVQNAFVRMIQHKEKYFADLQKRTGAFIVVMVKSESLNILRREKRLGQSDVVEPIIDNNEPSAFRIIAGKETVNRLRYHVSLLDEVSQTLFEMKYVLEKPNVEISEIIGISENAVAIRIHRLKKALIEVLRKEGFIDD